MFEASLSLSDHSQPLATKPGPGRVFCALPAHQPAKPAFFTPILRPLPAALWRLYAPLSYPFIVNDTNQIKDVI